MKKKDLLEALEEMPDDTEIGLIVSDRDDNWDGKNMTIDDTCLADNYVELVVNLEDGYYVKVDKELLLKIAKEAKKKKKIEELYKKSIDYIIKCITTGKRQQAIQIFYDNKYKFEDLYERAKMAGILEGYLFHFIDSVIDYSVNRRDGAL